MVKKCQLHEIMSAQGRPVIIVSFLIGVVVYCNTVTESFPAAYEAFDRYTGWKHYRYSDMVPATVRM
jgi:hypothetical protein